MAIVVYWIILYCLVSGVLSVVWSSILYVMVWIWVPVTLSIGQQHPITV